MKSYLHLSLCMCLFSILLLILYIGIYQKRQELLSYANGNGELKERQREIGESDSDT
jgi:hypothetical protein